MKKCYKCLEVKSINDFYRKGHNGKTRGECKNCSKSIYYQYAERHPEKVKKYDTEFRLKRLGITFEQYTAIGDSQKWVCHICREKGRGQLHVDHDHTTGVVRGLLCAKCNHGIGHFRDSVVLLKRAATYLKKYS